MSSIRRSLQGAGDYFKGSGSITVSTLAAGAVEDLTIADSNAAVGQVVSVSLLDAGMEDGIIAIVGAWVSAAGTISIRVHNIHASSAATGGAVTAHYTLQA